MSNLLIYILTDEEPEGKVLTRKQILDDCRTVLCAEVRNLIECGASPFRVSRSIDWDEVGMDVASLQEEYEDYMYDRYGQGYDMVHLGMIDMALMEIQENEEVDLMAMEMIR